MALALVASKNNNLQWIWNSELFLVMSRMQTEMTQFTLVTWREWKENNSHDTVDPKLQGPYMQAE